MSTCGVRRVGCESICMGGVGPVPCDRVAAVRVELMRDMSGLIFFFQAEDGIRDIGVTGVQTCALPICPPAVKLPIHDPKEWEPPAWCNWVRRSWIGSFTAGGRKIGCLTGMVPSEWSTGNGQRLGSITKVGVPAIRRIITEMVWRMILFQPQYKAVQKWRAVLEGSNRGLKKKAVVAIGRQLMVDLWRLQTGRISAQELNLIMVEG